MASDEVYQQECNELIVDIQQIYNEYQDFVNKMCLATNASVGLSKTRDQFYSAYRMHNDTNNKGMDTHSYSKCTEDIYDKALKIFCNSIFGSLNSWISSIHALINKIDKTQKIHSKIQENQNKLQTLLTKQQSQQISNELNQNKNILSIANIFQHKNDSKLSNEINEILSFVLAMNSELNLLKTEIKSEYEQLIQNKYTKFDGIYIQIIESQKYFNAYCAAQLKKLQNKKVSQIKTEKEEKQYIQFENMINVQNVKNTKNNNSKRNDFECEDFLSQISQCKPKKEKGIQSSDDYITNAFSQMNIKHTNNGNSKSNDVFDIFDLITVQNPQICS